MIPYIQPLLASQRDLWTPAKVTTKKLWLIGDSNTGSNGSNITTWSDSSGQGNDATGQGASSTKPTVVTNNLNGHVVVRLTAASSQYFSLPDFLTSFTAGTAFLVVKLANDPTSSTKDSGLLKFGSTSGGNQNNHYGFNGDNVVYDDFGSSSRTAWGNPTPSLAAWHILSLGVNSSSSALAINVDSFSGTTALHTTGWTTSPRIGTGGGLATFTDGWIAEIFFANELLINGGNNAMQARIEGYLAYKYGIQSVLPGGHTYKTTPPYT